MILSQMSRSPTSWRSPSHEKATCSPSGESVGVTSEPAVVVSGTMRGASGGTSERLASRTTATMEGSTSAAAASEAERHVRCSRAGASDGLVVGSEAGSGAAGWVEGSAAPQLPAPVR